MSCGMKAYLSRTTIAYNLNLVLGNLSPPLLTKRLAWDLVQIIDSCQDGCPSFVCKSGVNEGFMWINTLFA